MTATAQEKFGTEGYSTEEVNQILNGEGDRLAYSVGELAERLGANKRRLQQLLDDKGVPTFFLATRRMITAENVRKILDGTIDISRDTTRERDESGVIVGGPR